MTRGPDMADRFGSCRGDCQPRGAERPRRGPLGVPDNSAEVLPRTGGWSFPSPNLGHTHGMSGTDFNGENRPWGRFIVLDDTPTCKVKRIIVDPGQRLSYQLHHRRSEHWIVVAGTAVVTLDGADIIVEPGSSIDIPRESDHRVRNDGTEPLEFIEVQMGDYFGEDDIVRLEDDYGRAGQ